MKRTTSTLLRSGGARDTETEPNPLAPRGFLLAFGSGQHSPSLARCSGRGSSSLNSYFHDRSGRSLFDRPLQHAVHSALIVRANRVGA